MEYPNFIVEREQMREWAKRCTMTVTFCAGIVALIAVAYIVLCAWAGGHVLPNSTVGGVDVGGVSAAQLSQRLDQAAQDYQGQTVNLTYDTVSIPCDLDQAGLTFDEDAALEQLNVGGESFLRRGADWIRALLGQGSQVEGALTFQNQDYVDGLLEQVTDSLDQPVVQHQAQVGDSSILFTRGQAGTAVNTETTQATLLERISQGDFSDLPLEASITEPDDPDFQTLYEQVHTDPTDASLNPSTYEITPSSNGVSFDVTAAQTQFYSIQPGESYSIPLTVTQPQVTTEKLQASLFADLLGEAKSTVKGSANRASNVRLAGELCNGSIVLPGEEFSYWSKISPCSASQGFLPAPGYSGGKTVETIGGGVCQMSSSIYYASLLSNLEIVERHNHTYAIDYLPDGCDAMFSGGYSDYRFKNNTAYPIKIVVKMVDRSLTVQIWGTKTDSTYVKIETKELSRTQPTTVYKIDNSVPAGTTKTEQTSYIGRKVEAYRCVYSANGTLLSKTLESVSNYQKRDAIVLVNSADAAKYGLIDEAAPEVTPMDSEATVPPLETTQEEEMPPLPSVEVSSLEEDTTTSTELEETITPATIEDVPTTPIIDADDAATNTD
jgi:vancomycin resistance protein YoaR